MEVHGFTETGNWYKGNLHCHTTESDGEMTPAEVVEAYQKKGYHFLCLSDHDIYTDYSASLDRQDFILLPGLEASAWLQEKTKPHSWLKVHHIHGILGTEKMQNTAVKPRFGHREKIEPPRFYGSWNGAGEAQKLTDELLARGYFAVYNHPDWSRVREEEFIHTDGIWALEIFNYGTDREDHTGTDTIHWDIMLREGKKVFAVASDDNHRKDLKDAFGGFVVVKAKELTHEEIVSSLQAGNYYSSSGPAIYDWGIRNGKAYVDCSDVFRIDFIAGNKINDGTAIVCDNYEETICHGEYELLGHESYVRVECTDCYGRTAWSNPIFLIP